ncbi:Lipase (class 3) [compost metagenome]
MNTTQKEDSAKAVNNDLSLDQAAILLSAISYYSETGNLDSVFNDNMAPYGWEISWQPVSEYGGNYALIANNGDQYLLAIRGSVLDFSESALEDWFEEDFNVLAQDPWTYIETNGSPMVSAGTSVGMNNLNNLFDFNGNSITDFLGNLTDSDSLCVTGHSLGGGLAPIYALYLKYWYSTYQPTVNPAMNIVTFAGPTVSNADFGSLFIQYFNGSYTAYVNIIDIVPMAASNIANIGNLYFGDDNSDEPRAADIYMPSHPDITLQAFFDAADVAIITAQAYEESWYTPLADGEVTQLNTDSAIISNDYTGFDAWMEQAGSQHGSNNYLQLMGLQPINLQ